jgi:subtilisin family serine protease
MFGHLIKKAPILFLLSFITLGIAYADEGKEHDDDEILLQLAPGVDIRSIEHEYDVETEETNVVPGIRPPIYRVKVDDEDNLEATVHAMEKDRRILKVEFNLLGETPEGVRRTLAVIDTTPTRSEYVDQKAFERVRGRQAHSFSRGEGVTVAVIDTGVDYNHPQLADHILRDGNKIVGFDFVDGDKDPMDEGNGLDDDNDSQIDEGAGHGTHVAGIIAALAPGAKIMPLRVLNSEGVGTVDAVVKALNFVQEFADDNSDHRDGLYKPIVVNLSLGLPEQSFTLLAALREILNEGIPVIASAGNHNSSAKQYPAAGDIGSLDVVAVSATDRNDKKASFSNFGEWINLSAPGVGIYSTFIHSRFASWDGTSMAAPFVSAETALIMSKLVNRNRGRHLELNQILRPLKNGTDYIYSINPKFKPKNQLGTGRIDLESSVRIAMGADILTVKNVIYQSAGKKLTVEINSTSAPQAILSIKGFGKMKYDTVKHIYTFQKSGVNPAPSTITITSSEGGLTSPRVAIQ